MSIGAFRRTKLLRKSGGPELKSPKVSLKKSFPIPEELEIEIAKVFQFETEEIGLPRLLVKNSGRLGAKESS
ncbi:hypothetical protein BUALT_Bualt01G0086100 [Buddleja alternifolia]|uniref:Uncharacterized protein n=1 Tax=Buddleja alternifolia TaxID=168488 RepID=A0AAV6YGE0_9LAMI|nr:hypothetical protein BUALT_Bualt01G0086100 [Buddleja alternifolia]